MSLPPERIGDHGQRYEVRWDDQEDGHTWRVLGWHSDRTAAESMASAWMKRPDHPFAWVVDRSVLEEWPGGTEISK